MQPAAASRRGQRGRGGKTWAAAAAGAPKKDRAAKVEALPQPACVKPREVHSRIIAEALTALVANHGLATGPCAVNSLNPDGPPLFVHSLEVIAMPGVTPAVFAQRLVDAIKATGVEGADELQVAVRGDLIVVTRDQSQLITVSGFPRDLIDMAEKVAWRVPITHAGQVWNVIQLKPRYLLQQFARRDLDELSARLDMWVAERAHRGLDTGGPYPDEVEPEKNRHDEDNEKPDPQAVFVPMLPPNYAALWQQLNAWADVLLRVPIIPLSVLYGAERMFINPSDLVALHADARHFCTLYRVDPAAAYSAFVYGSKQPPYVLLSLFALPYLGPPSLFF